MKVLFVLPVLESTGEATTVLNMTRQLVAAGDAVAFLAVRPAFDLLTSAQPESESYLLADDASANRAQWERAIAGRPDVVVFADFQSQWMSAGVAAVENPVDWLNSVRSLDCLLVTLDHCGMAQRAVAIDFGPYHLGSRIEHFPPLPLNLKVLLPCPMHEPGPVPGRIGVPFQYMDVSSPSTEMRRQARAVWSVGHDRLLIVHPVTRAASMFAHAFGISYYRFLPRLLAHHLGPLTPRVTLVSINAGALLPPGSDTGLEVMNVEGLPPQEFDTLLASADLLLTENLISVTLGRAIHAQVPAVVVRGEEPGSGGGQGRSATFSHLLRDMSDACPGGVTPFTTFPVDVPAAVAATGLFDHNSIRDAFAEINLFEEESGIRLRELITTSESRALLGSNQSAYSRRIEMLPNAPEILHQLIAGRSDMASTNEPISDDADAGRHDAKAAESQ